MELNKAKNVAAKVLEYTSLRDNILEVSASIDAFPGGRGTTTVTIPRRYLSPLRKMMEEDLAFIEKEIEAL